MLLDQLMSDLSNAVKSGDTIKTATLRYLIAAVKKYAIDNYPPRSSSTLTDEDVFKIIRQQVKTHQESIFAFEKGNRPDLVEKERAELAILKSCLPAEIADEEIKNVVLEVTSGVSLLDFGQVMGMVMRKIAGRARGERVAGIVREVLAESIK